MIIRASRPPPRPETDAYVPASVAQCLLQRLASIDADADTILRRSRVPYSAREFQEGLVTRLPRADFTVLSRECILAFEDYVSRQEGHPPWEPRVTRMLCYCLINASNLSEAIDLAADFLELLGNRAPSRLSLEIDRGSAVLYMKTVRTQSTAAVICDLIGLWFFHRLFSWLIRSEIAVTEVTMSYRESLKKELIPGYFSQPITFGAKCNALRFPVRYLKRPLVRSFDELVPYLAYFPYDILPPEYSPRPASETVRLAYRAALIEGAPMPTLSELARLFGQSSATMRRRLAEERTSAQRVKDEFRRDMAIELLKHSRLTLEEVAERVGFASYKAFGRAFRQWTGKTASAWRASR